MKNLLDYSCPKCKDDRYVRYELCKMGCELENVVHHHFKCSHCKNRWMKKRNIGGGQN